MLSLNMPNCVLWLYGLILYKNDERRLEMNITFEKVTFTLKKNLAALIAVAILCFCGAFAVMKLFVPASYYTNASFYIKTSGKQTTTTTSSDINVTRLLADTFILILDTNNFFETVHENLPADVQKRYDVYSLRSATTFGSLDSTEIIRVSFESKHSDDVVTVTNTILSCVQPHITAVYGECQNNIVDSPSRANVSSTKTSVICVGASVAGVAAVFCFLLLRDVFDVHIRTAAKLSERYAVPILGTVPEFSTVKKNSKKEASDDGKAEQ